MHSREAKIKKALIKEISDIIRQDLNDPRIKGIISVTYIKLSSDYRYAKVYVSVFGNDEQKQNIMDALEDSTSFIRKEIGRRIKLRYTPELKFVYDDSIEKGIEITDLLKHYS